MSRPGLLLRVAVSAVLALLARPLLAAAGLALLLQHPRAALRSVMRARFQKATKSGLVEC